MDRETKLLPCPFCDESLNGPFVGEAFIQYWTHPGGVLGDRCLFSGKWVYQGQVSAWNTRPTQPPLDLRVAVDIIHQITNLEPAEIAKSPSYVLELAREALSTLTAQADSGRDAGVGEVG